MSRLTYFGAGRHRRRIPPTIAKLLSLIASGVIVASGLQFASVPAALAAPPDCGSGNPANAAGTCSVTIDVRDFSTGLTLPTFNYIVNVDNSKLPSDPNSLSNESHSPMVRIGNQDRTSFTLPDGRYLVTARAYNHKMWGAYLTLPNDVDSNGNLAVRIDLTEQSPDHPLPLGKVRVFVFNDNAWTNGAPDTEEAGLAGFKVGLEEQTASQVTVDYNNIPLCESGNTGPQAGCLTGSDGFLQINDLGPATYFINVIPPDGPCDSDPNSAWYQTTTIDGGLDLIAPTEEGADGTGVAG